MRIEQRIEELKSTLEVFTKVQDGEIDFKTEVEVWDCLKNEWQTPLCDITHYHRERIFRVKPQKTIEAGVVYKSGTKMYIVAYCGVVDLWGVYVFHGTNSRSYSIRHLTNSRKIPYKELSSILTLNEFDGLEKIL